METVDSKKQEVSTAHRCDRCGAQAYTIASRLSEAEGGVLMFCRHHSRDYAEGLNSGGWLFMDMETGEYVG